MAKDGAQTAAQRWPGELVQRVVRLDEGADGFPRSWIMLFPVGRFTHPEFGKLNFTRARLARIKQLFDRRVRHIDIALDADHAAARGDTRATGWIESLELREPGDGNDAPTAGLWGRIRWTPYGARLLKDQEYRYFSPEFGPWKDPENGQEYDDVLIGGGLTNRPFLKCMEAIALAGDGGGGVSISRKPWGSVKKSELPRSCFLIQGDAGDKSTWKLPVYEGAGEKDAQGHYTKRGPLNINGVQAAIDAIGGARTGQKMNVPPAVRAKLDGWMKRYGASGSGASSERGEKAASEGMMGTKRAAATATKAAYQPGGDSTRVTRRREEQSGEIDQEAARAWLEGQERRRMAEQADDEDEAATEEEDLEGELELDEEELEDGYELADSAQDDDMEMADGGDGFDKSSNTHGAMTCSAEDHQHGKYGPHSHDGDADHSDAPLAEDAGDEEYAEPGSDDTEEYDEADGDGPDEGDEEEPGAKPAKKPATRSGGKGRSGGSKKASEQGARAQGTHGAQQGGRRHVGDEHGNEKQVSTLAEQARRLAEVEAKAKRLEEANAKMAYQLYETEVGKTLAGWQSQSFQFKDGVRVKDGKHVPVMRSGRIALSKVFMEKYRDFMLHEAIRMAPAAHKALNELLEASFVGTVDLTARGSSFDQETRMTRGGNAGRGPAGAQDSERLQQRAEQIAAERGKSLSESSDAELFSIYEQAGKEIGYR